MSSKVRTISAEFLEDGSGKKLFVFAGKSTAEKPVNDLIAMGSVFMEVDTGISYSYDEEDGSWTAPGGGSNGD